MNLFLIWEELLHVCWVSLAKAYFRLPYRGSTHTMLFSILLTWKHPTPDHRSNHITVIIVFLI